MDAGLPTAVRWQKISAGRCCLWKSLWGGAVQLPVTLFPKHLNKNHARAKKTLIFKKIRIIYIQSLNGKGFAVSF
jgi:hypothetical protein